MHIFSWLLTFGLPTACGILYPLLENSHMNIWKNLCTLLRHPKRSLKQAVKGELLDEFLLRDKAAWEQAGYLHPQREGSMRGMMIFLAHCIEKGLTMPRFEPGHGRNRIQDLCRVVIKYRESGYDRNAFEYRVALSVLAEYQHVHEELEYALPEDLSRAIQDALAGESASQGKQIDMTPKKLWQHANSAFPAFSASRHSVRNFAADAPRADILAAINLATNAPCACNKQYVRVHMYEGADKVRPLLALQNGNTGFGDMSGQLLIVTADMNYMHWRGERHEIYLCAGLFAMNLGYALHYHHVAHCMLNWQVPPHTDRQMRELAGIPENEEIALLIICGLPPAEFKATASPRHSGGDITIIH